MREPRGWFGRLFMGRLINRASRSLIVNTVTALDIQPGMSVLEIGFGGGAGLELALAAVGHGQVFGIDISRTMVEFARRRFARQISDGRLQVAEGSVSALPFPERMFDRVFAINNIYFWGDTAGCLQEIGRALKPGGRVGIGNRSKEHMSRFAVTKQGFQLFSASELEEALAGAGFRDLRVEHKRNVESGKFPDQVIAIGTK